MFFDCISDYTDVIIEDVITDVIDFVSSVPDEVETSVEYGLVIFDLLICDQCCSCSLTISKFHRNNRVLRFVAQGNFLCPAGLTTDLQY